MTRLLAAFLVLCTQVFAVFAPGNVVVCMHEDGTSAVELVGSLCCDESREEPLPCSPVQDEAQEPSVQSGGDRCRDVPFQQDQSQVSRASFERSPQSVQEHSDVAPAIAACIAPEGLVPPRSLPHALQPRPPERRAWQARRFILRC